MKYRSRMDIAAAMLNAARQGALKTQMMYGAFLSFPQVEEYLVLLLEQGLLEHFETTNRYYTTEKGMRFLKMYNEVGWMIFPRGAMRPMSSREGRQYSNEGKRHSIAS